jgi:hypothetical protein
MEEEGLGEDNQKEGERHDKGRNRKFEPGPTISR